MGEIYRQEYSPTPHRVVELCIEVMPSIGVEWDDVGCFVSVSSSVLA